MTNIPEQTERVNTTFSQLAVFEPFIAAVVGRLRREITDKVPTAATNGAYIKFNPDFIAKQSPQQLFGLALHEAMHVVLMHMWRREGRDPALWNVANDAVINAYIRQQKYDLPEGGVELPWVKPDMSSEEVYNRLFEEAKENGGGRGQKGGPGAPSDGQGAGGFDGQGDLVDADTEPGSEERGMDMQAAILAAAKMAKECGQGSALIDRILGSLGPSKVRWQDALRNMMTEAARADHNYSRPSRRFIGSGLYLPSLHSPRMGPLLVGFDVSGSIGEEQANAIASEIIAIISDTAPEFTEIVYCADSITGTQRFDADDVLEIKPVGTGGTRFKPVFDHAAETGEPYVGMIYFTDMEGNLAECTEPPFPVIWADFSGEKHTAPFGDYIEVPKA